MKLQCKTGWTIANVPHNTYGLPKPGPQDTHMHLKGNGLEWCKEEVHVK